MQAMPGWKREFQVYGGRRYLDCNGARGLAMHPSVDDAELAGAENLVREDLVEHAHVRDAFLRLPRAAGSCQERTNRAVLIAHDTAITAGIVETTGSFCSVPGLVCG